MQFFSLLNAPGEEGYPPSVSMTLPPSLNAVSQTVELPLLGWPLQYPFDDYRLRLGLVLERVRPAQLITTACSRNSSANSSGTV